MAALPRSRKLLCSGREETPDRKKPRCGTGSWYPTVVSECGRTARWKSGSLEPRQHVPLIAASAPASPKGHPSPRGRGHEWPLFHAHASFCAPGAKKHPTGRNPGAAQVRGTHPCVSNTWRNKEMGQPQSVPAPEKMGQPAEGCEQLDRPARRAIMMQSGVREVNAFLV